MWIILPSILEGVVKCWAVHSCSQTISMFSSVCDNFLIYKHTIKVLC